MTQLDADLPSIDAVFPLLLRELRGLAHRQLAREHGALSLQTTELVHEAYLRLAGDARVTRLGRPYFFGTAARAMRQVLVDAARRRNALQLGVGAPLLTLEGGSWGSPEGEGCTATWLTRGPHTFLRKAIRKGQSKYPVKVPGGQPSISIMVPGGECGGRIAEYDAPVSPKFSIAFGNS